MTRQSAATVKGYYKKTPLNDKPAEGTLLREIYDFLFENRGLVVGYEDYVDFSGRESIPGARYNSYLSLNYARLNDFYQTDIRCVGFRKYCLCGRWEGSKYIDYVAMRAGKINLERH